MANITVLSEHAMERSTYLVPVAFTDEDGAAVTPTAVTWSLVKANGDVVNGREDVALTPATSVGILLYGADLAILDGQGYEARSVVVEYTYDSTLGDDIPGKQEIVFTIANLKRIPRAAQYLVDADEVDLVDADGALIQVANG